MAFSSKKLTKLWNFNSKLQTSKRFLLQLIAYHLKNSIIGINTRHVDNVPNLLEKLDKVINWRIPFLSLMLHHKDIDDSLTSVTIDENFLVPCHMCMVVLVTDSHCQSAGYCLGWMATVTHNNGYEELFLTLTVKHP